MKIDYYAYHSGMTKWNAGFKVLLAVGTLLMVIVFNRVRISLFAILVMSGLTLIAGRLPIRTYAHYLTIPFAFMLLSGVMIAVDFAGTPKGDFNFSLCFFYVCVTRQGIATAVQVLLKAFAGMSALYMMAFSTPMGEFICVLQNLHLPGLLVELMHLIYRYIFILLETAERMQTAAKVRLGYGSLRQGFRTFAGIAGNLFILSMQKAERYYDALAARGYDGKLEFLREQRPVSAGQLAGAAAYIAAIIILGRFTR